MAEHPGQHRTTGRLFFALWPDAATRAALAGVQRDLAGAGRPLHREDLHITLAFLGQVDEARLPCLGQAAGGVRAAPFSLILTRCGWWRGPRVAWCAPDQVPAPLTELVDQLWAGLEACGFAPEARPFRPHVTLARKARALPAAELETPIPWACGEFVLVESLSGPEPPRYKVLQRWPLVPPGNSGLENQ